METKPAPRLTDDERQLILKILRLTEQILADQRPTTLTDAVLDYVVGDEDQDD